MMPDRRKLRQENTCPLELSSESSSHSFSVAPLGLFVLLFLFLFLLLLAVPISLLFHLVSELICSLFDRTVVVGLFIRSAFILGVFHRVLHELLGVRPGIFLMPHFVFFYLRVT